MLRPTPSLKLAYIEDLVQGSVSPQGYGRTTLHFVEQASVEYAAYLCSMHKSNETSVSKLPLDPARDPRKFRIGQPSEGCNESFPYT